MKPNHYRRFFVVLLFLITTQINISQGQSKTQNKSFVPTRIETDFDISAQLTNPAWQQATPVYIAYELQPDPTAMAPVETSVKVLYSAQNLYIAFVANDPNPEKIRAQITDRDASFGNDYVGLILDTFGNSQQAFEFFVNPLGVQMDGFRTVTGGENISFDAVWYSDGALTDSGYVAIMKIPFKSLNFPEKNIQDWRAHFFRNYPRNARHQLNWTYVSADNPCFLCQAGTMENIKGIEGGGSLELLPYFLSYQSSTLDDPTNLSSGLDPEPIQVRVGGSMAYAPTSTTSLHAVINPDFSQIETDAAQIAINKSFALLYDEQRPFFIRGADLFKTSENLYYSRTINNPLAATKFTHQGTKYNIGWVTAYDKNTPFVIPGQFESDFVSSSLNSYVNILRGKYSFGSESYIGGLVTTRNQVEGANYVGGVDWQFKLADNYYLNGQLGYSHTKEISDSTLFNDKRILGQSDFDASLNGEQYNGSLINVAFSRNAKYYNFSLAYKSYSPTFQSQTGFINSTNSRAISARQTVSYYPATNWLSRGNASIFARWEYDFSGQFIERLISLRFTNRLAGQTRLTLGYKPLNDERFRGRHFKNVHQFMININSKPLEALMFGGELNIGRFIYRTDNPQLGKGYNLSAHVRLRLLASLQLRFNYSYSKLSSLDGVQEYFSGNIMRFTGNYNFSRQFSFRLITQYSSFSDGLQIYPLLYYKLNPFSKFYIGMTDYLNHLPGAEGFNDFKQTNRQFFVKFQYLIQR